MQIDRLSYGIGLDLSQLDRDAAAADAVLNSLGSKPLGAIATGGIDSDKIAVSVAAIGNKLANGVNSGLRGSATMLTAFGAHINTMFDRTAGAMIEMFRRIDAMMKFPTFDAAITRVRQGLYSVGTTWSGLWSKGTAGAKEASVTMGGLVPILTQLAAGTRSVEASTSKLYRPAFSLASAWDAIRAKVALTREQMALAESRPPPAGKRPGVGRAFSLPKDTIDASARALVAAFNAAERLQTAITRFGVVSRPAFAGASRAAAMFGEVAKGAALGLYINLMTPVRALSFVGSGFAAAYQAAFRFRYVVSSLGDVAGKTFHALFEGNSLASRAIAGTATTVTRLSSALLHVGTLGVFRKHAGEASLASRSVSGLTGSVRSFGRDLLVAFGVVGIAYKVAEGLKSSVKAASDLNETVSASKEVFGSSFGVINDQVERNAKSFGLLRRSQLDAANGFGSLAQGAGMSQAASAKLSNEFTMLAADLASFKNLSFEEATQKLTSALAGESEPLRRFGVLIDDDAVKAYALSHGLASSAKSIDNNAKMAARAALIQQGLATANGDLARTADSAANQFRKAGGGLANFSERIGGLLLPAVNLGIGAFNDLLASGLEVFEGSLPTIQSWAGYLTSAVEGVGRVVRNLGAYWRVAQLRVGEFAANAVAWINTLPENFGPMVLWLENNWANMLRDLIDGTASAFTNLGTNAVNFGKAFWSALSGGEFTFEWTPLLKGFTAATEALPELIKPELLSVQDEIDRIWAEVDKKEKLRAASLAKALPKPKDNLKPAEDAKKDVERKLAAAVEIGSKESYSIIQGNRVGSRNDGIKSVAANTKATADTTRELLNWTKNHPNGFTVETAGI